MTQVDFGQSIASGHGKYAGRLIAQGSNLPIGGAVLMCRQPSDNGKEVIICQTAILAVKLTDVNLLIFYAVRITRAKHLSPKAAYVKKAIASFFFFQFINEYYVLILYVVRRFLCVLWC